VRLNEIYEAYKDRVEFILIYIREAHPSDGWQTPQNLYDDVVYSDPTSREERFEVAGACQVGLDLKLPFHIDTIDNEVEGKYIAEPIRLYVIDRDGVLRFNGAPGPQGFDTEAWEGAIQTQLAEAAE
jgi:Iodothyronine deiodinase